MSKIFDTESETALLALVISNPEKVYELLDLKWYMFSLTSYQIIWSAIEELREQQLIPEKTLLFSKLENTGKIEEAGGSAFLDVLLKGEYRIENLTEYERGIVNNYRVKKIITLMSDVQTQVKSSLPVEEILANVKENLASLENFTQGVEMISMQAGLKDVWESIKNSVADPGIPGYSTGLVRLDLTTFGLNKDKLWVIAGRPGMGKSAVMLNFALSLGKVKVPTLILSKEMSYIELVKRMISTHSQVPFGNILLGNLVQEDLDKVTQTIEELKTYPIIVNDKFLPFDVTGVIRRAVSTKGVKVVFIDYLQLLSERGEDQTEELGRIIRSLKLLAHELQITIVVLAQLNRSVESRQDKRPILSDIRQCGNVEEDVDLAVFLYRDELYNAQTKHPKEIELLIRKNRNGAIGTLAFEFDAPIFKITDNEKL